MKKFLGIVFTILTLSVIGCNENLLPTSDDSSFEKRTPIQKDTIRRMSVEQVLTCLGLTREQHSVIIEILHQSKECNIECKKEFNNTLKTLREEYTVKLKQYRNVEKTDEIKKEIKIITFEFRQSQRDLEQEYREKMTDCTKTRNLQIESKLTESQLNLWNIWLATGRLPCENRKP
jgi:hypothetical protein